MQAFREITPYEWRENPFEQIGNQWMLIAAKRGDRVNMMTASWGGCGILWQRPVVYAFIRPQRYTKELVDASGSFSCTFFPAEYHEKLMLCGTKSGREIDKVEQTGFQVLEDGGIPYFAQANTALLCKALFRQRMDPACFLAPELDAAHYAARDYHDIYVGEIKKVLIKE